MTDILNCFFCTVQAGLQPLLMRKIFCTKPKISFLLLFTALHFAAIILPLPLPAGIILSVFSVVMSCRLAFGAGFGKSLLYGILSAEVMWLCCGLFDSLMSVMSIPADPAAVTIFIAAGYILVFASYWSICSAAHKIIKNEPSELRSIMIILIPLILIFIMEIYIVKVPYSAADTNFPTKKNIGLLAVQLLGTASIFCILYAYKKCADSFQMHEKIRLYEHEYHYRQTYADEIKTYYNTAKSLRHDYKNHILVIGGLLRKEQFYQAVNYISELDKAMEKTDLQFHTGCLILDILFTSKLSDVRDINVKINCTAVPEIDETDICTIFANSLDNAVSAVSETADGEEKFISVFTKKRGELFLINIENSYNGKPFKIGTGIENIICTAEKYGGTAKITANENIFSLKIILCNSHH